MNPTSELWAIDALSALIDACHVHVCNYHQYLVTDGTGGAPRKPCEKRFKRIYNLIKQGAELFDEVPYNVQGFLSKSVSDYFDEAYIDAMRIDAEEEDNYND